MIFYSFSLVIHSIESNYLLSRSFSRPSNQDHRNSFYQLFINKKFLYSVENSLSFINTKLVSNQCARHCEGYNILYSQGAYSLAEE